MYVIVGDGIEMCTAKGNQYPLGKAFSFMDGCYEYHCDCMLNGSWECPAERARNRCEDATVQETEQERGNNTYFSFFLVFIFVYVNI